MSDKKKQSRLQAGSRKKRAIKVEQLEDRLLLTINEYPSSYGLPIAITSAFGNDLAYILNGGDHVGIISSSNPSSGSSYLVNLTSNDPVALAYNGQYLFVTQNDQNTVAEIDSSGNIVQQFEDVIGMTPGSPSGITADASGNIFFTDTTNNTVMEIPFGSSPDYAPQDVTGTIGQPDSITSTTRNGDNVLAFIEAGGSEVGTYDETTHATTSTNLPEGSYGYAITFDSTGDIDVADEAGNRIVQLSGSNFATVNAFSTPTPSSGPEGITADSNGNVYFTERFTNNVGVFNATTHAITEISTPSENSGPIGITIGPDGNPWFTEYNANNIGNLVGAPTAEAQSFTTNLIDTSNSNDLTITSSSSTNLLTGATGGSGPLTVSQTGTHSTEHGSVTFDANGDGGFVYTPNTGYTGSDSFTYTVTDGTNTSASATVSITVDGAPVANNDSYITPVNQTLTVSNVDFGVLANDTDPNSSHTITANVVTQPNYGTLTLNANGSFTYIPTNGFHGTDSFQYQDVDSDGVTVSSNATVTLIVDTAPVANGDSYTTDAGTPLTVSLASSGVLANDTAYNGDILAVASADVGTFATAHGSITMASNGTFTYTPSGSYTGTDTFSYYDYDFYQNSFNPASVTFTIYALPTGTTHTYEIGQGNVLNVNAANGVLHGDTGIGSLTAVLVTGPSNATNGGFTLNSNGSFIYDPLANYSGTDSFTYKVYDGIADSAPETVTLKVDAPPTVITQNYVTNPNTTLTENAANGILNGNSDTFNTSLSAYLGTNPSHGTVTVNTDGSFTYVPNDGYHGTDSFQYYTYDGYRYSQGDGTVNLVIDSSPVVQNQSYDDVENTSLNELAGQGLLVGATQASSESLTAVDLTQPSHGTVTVNANGSFSYIPTAGYHGPDSFTYTANDGTQNGNTGTVELYVDQPPVGVADNYNVVENTGLNKNAASGVLANDTDTDSQPLSAALVETTAHGTLNLFQDGSFTYTPNTGYYGNDTFTYQANDGITDSAITTVTIHVDAPPVGVNDSYNVVENQTFNQNAAGGVLANDTQAQNESLTASLLTNPGHGTLTFYEDGSFSYVPTAGYYGSDSFTYKPYDGIANGNVTTVSIFVDSPPVAVNDSYLNVLQNSFYSVNAANGVLANDTQAQGEPLTAILATNPSHGSLDLPNDGSFDYGPGYDFYGTDSFTYYAYDGYTESLTPATVTIRVDATPVGVADNYEVAEGGSLSVNSDGGVLANDSQAQDDNLTAVNFTNPSHGTLTPDSGDNAGDGGFTYTPNAGFYGTDTFTYEVNDGYQTSAPVTVSILVDQPPVGHDDYYSVAENTSLLYENAQNGELANDTSFMNQPLTATNFTNPAVGTIDTNPNGAFNYHPVANYYGDVTFTYVPYDGFAYGNTTTVHVHVDALVNAVNDTYNAQEGLPLTVNATNGVLANDSQAQNETLTPSVQTQPAHGTLSLNADGSFTYTPNPQFYGTDSFTYQDNDGYQNSTVATVTINVAEDFAPTANNVNQTVGEGGITVNAPGVLTGDTDSNGQTLTAVLVSEPSHGSLTFSANGSYVYIPNSSFGSAGSDSFTFRTFDNVLTSPLATVTLTFDGTYYAPTAEAQTYSVQEGSTLTESTPGLLIGADDFWNLPLTATIVTEPSDGTLTPDNNGDGGFVYTPTANFHGTDTFTYEASNGHTDSTTQTVTINVSQTTGEPVAANDSYSVNENASLTKNAVSGVLANDSDPNSLPLNAILVSDPSHGSVTLNGNGSFTYTPVAGYYGTDTFTYEDSDGEAYSNTATVTLTIGQVYYPPTAINQTYTIANGGILNISAPGILNGDTDPNGLSLNAQLFGNPSHDSDFNLNNNGSFTYSPVAGYVGTDTFTYKAADGQAISSLATVTITITNPITVTGTTISATAGTAFNGNVGSFTDANPTAPISNFTATIHWGDSTTSAGSITQPGGVGTTFEVSGSHTYSTTGSLTATVVITDNNENTASANANANVATGAPVAVNDPNYSLNENGYLNADSSFGVLANDTDPQGDPLTAILVSNPSHGTVSLNANGSFIYTPTANFYGSDSFTYKDNNGVLNGNTATVTLTVDQVYYPPTAINQTYTTPNGFLLSSSAPGVLTGDTDPNGLSLNAQLIGSPSHASSFNLGTDGSFTYITTPGFVGTDTFTYKATDGQASSSLATVTITITNPITVTGTTISATPETAFNGNVGSFTDANPTAPISNFTATIHWGDSTTSAGSITQPGGVGTTFEVSGSHTYSTTGSLTATVVITDNNENTASANTVVAVGSVSPTAPIAENDSYSTPEATALSVNALTGVLANDTDPQSDPLTAILVGNPSHGTVQLDGNGAFVYTPVAGFYGTDSFSYKDSDGLLTGNTATVTLSVSQVFSPPVAVNESDTVNENTPLSISAPGVLIGATDPQSLALTAADVTNPSHGSLTLNANGSFTYVPTAGYYGTDSFTYLVNDGHNNSNTATVTITVVQVTQPPVAANDSQTVGETGFTATTNAGGGDVLANDTDNSSNPLTALLVSEPSHGTLSFNANGTYIYTPNSSFGTSGTDSFTYRAFDGSLLSNVATVTLTFDGTYLEPTAQSQSYTVAEGATLTENAQSGLLNGASDYWTLPLTAIITNQPTHGTLTANSNGSFTYVPTSGYTGSDSFTYEANNGQASSTAQTVSLTITPVEQAPVAVNDNFTTAEGTTLTTSLQNSILAGDTDYSQTPLTAVLVDTTSHGSLTLNSDGTFTYTPTTDFSGTDSFTYEAFDGTSDSNIATVTLNVTPGETPPVATPDHYTTAEGTTLVVPSNTGVLANDTDNSPDPLSAILVSEPTNGTLTFNADGSFTYVPNAMFYGSDTFTYEATDGTNDSQATTVLLTVTPVAHPPVVVNSAFSTSEATTLNINGIGVLAGATDVDNLPLTASVVSNPTHGTLTLNANGSFTYVPDPTFTGTDSFTFQANDGQVESNTATVTLTVAPVDHAPVAQADSYSTNEGQTLTTSAANGVLANDTDNGPNPLTAVLVGNPTHGTLTLNANGSFTYVPTTGYSGTDSFSYQDSDGQLDSNVVTVSLTIVPTPKPTPVPGDYFGTGEADIAIYLVNQAEFVIRNPAGGADVVVPFGFAGAGNTLPAPGDYFGTGVTDIAAYLPSQAEFAIRNPAGGPDLYVPFGMVGAGMTIPAPGDYFGTGVTDIAAYLPSIGAFAIRNPAGGPDEIIPFGMAGVGKSIPIPGDYDGSGKTELAVYIPSLGEFAYRPADGGPDVIVRFGTVNDGSIPVPGDYDGSGKTEIAIYDPNYASFAYRPADGGPDVIEQFGIAGVGQTLPEPGDYNGSGHDELAAYLPASATFAIRPGGGQPDSLQQYGISGLGQTIPVTVVDQALAELPGENISALAFSSSDPSTPTSDAIVFPTETTTHDKKKHHLS